MFERFSPRAQQIVVEAQKEARDLKHNYIGTEHILLGLMHDEEGLAAQVLESLHVRINDVRDQVARIVGVGDEVTTGQIPFTPRAKKVLELSLREAMSLGHNFIGTEHILLGLARENDGVAARILLDFDVDAQRIREAVYETLGPHVGRPFLEPPRVRTRVGRMPRRARAKTATREVLVVGWLLFGVSLGIGVLIGWLIWG